MPHQRFAGRLVLIIGSAALAAGCGDNPGGPSERMVGVGVVGIEIQGPASIAPGHSAQYAVIERLSNGTTRAPSDATWASSDPSLVQVTSSGVATARSGAGEIVLSVKATMSASKLVLVLPPDTFRLVGSVTDTQGAAIPDARVEVIGGPSATTGADGAYRLYGLPPEVDVRVTKRGYSAVEHHIRVPGHTEFIFRMFVDVETWNLSGYYTLTLESAPGCNDASKPLTAELRRRSYDATMRRDGSRLQIVLTEPRFELWNDNAGRLFGTVTPTGATFVIGRDYAGWFSDLMERLSDGSRLEISGTANTTEASGVLSGAFSGWFRHQGANGEALGDCTAGRFTLSPR